MSVAGVAACNPVRRSCLRLCSTLAPAAAGHGGRRACAFTVAFSSTRRELKRGDVGMWQARMREALHYWSDGERERDGEGVFELR